MKSKKDRDFASGEYYHVFNRGIDGRNIFNDEEDLDRFFKGVQEFNSVESIGSLYENEFNKKFGRSMSKSEKLVDLVAYCLNPNHYHMIIQQTEDGGVTKFMKSIGNGYTKYLNNKLKRKGPVFQGMFGARHIDSDEYLLHLSAYVNLNDRVHQLGHGTSKFVKSRTSWAEYTKDVLGVCSKDIILEQIGGKDNYREMADERVEDILEKRLIEVFDDFE